MNDPRFRCGFARLFELLEATHSGKALINQAFANCVDDPLSQSVRVDLKCGKVTVEDRTTGDEVFYSQFSIDIILDANHKPPLQFDDSKQDPVEAQGGDSNYVELGPHQDLVLREHVESHKSEFELLDDMELVVGIFEELVLTEDHYQAMSSPRLGSFLHKSERVVIVVFDNGSVDIPVDTANQILVNRDCPKAGEV